MKALFITNVPSPYRVDFFNELGKMCDLTVLFEKSLSNIRDDSWVKNDFKYFKGILMKGKMEKAEYAFCKEVKKYIKDKTFDKIVCCDYSSTTGIYAILYMKIHHIKYFLEADGAFKGTGKGLKEKFKKFLIKGAEGYFSTSIATDEYYQFYGAKKDKIYRYPFSSLYEKDILKKISSEEEKKELKEKLGIREEKIVLTVGRFSYLKGYGKGYDVLLRAASKIDKSIGWYIVGDKPTDEFIKMTNDLGVVANVHYIDFMDKKEIKKYYMCSDIFVLMTVNDIWGLVINEAMACGLPIITTDKCNAGLELVKNDENGYILPVGDDEALAEKIKYILTNENIRNEMANSSIEKIKNYTIEKMVQKNLKILECL